MYLLSTTMACYSVPGRLDWKTSETMLHRRDVPSRCAWRKSVLHHSIRSPWFATGQEVLAVRGRPGHGCRARIGGSIPCQLLYPPPPPRSLSVVARPRPRFFTFPMTLDGSIEAPPRGSRSSSPGLHTMGPMVWHNAYLTLISHIPSVNCSIPVPHSHSYSL